MARMSNKRRLEWSFFLNDRGRITYNELICFYVEINPLIFIHYQL